MQPFIYLRTIRLQETDATGVLYFAEQFKIVLEAFEELLVQRGFSFKALTESPYFMPVVHAESDYLAPLYVGDQIEVRAQVERVGTSSVTMGYVLKKIATDEEVGRAKIVHVLVDRKTRASVPFPDHLRKLFASASRN